MTLTSVKLLATRDSLEIVCLIFNYIGKVNSLLLIYLLSAYEVGNLQKLFRPNSSSSSFPIIRQFTSLRHTDGPILFLQIFFVPLDL